MQPDHIIYARFQGPEIFLEQGRLLFSLLNAFSGEGYRISLDLRLGEKPLERYGQMVFDLAGLETKHTPPSVTEQAVYLYDRPDPGLLSLPWCKRLRVRFDLFSPFWSSDPIIMPYFMYPLHVHTARTQLPSLRACPRKARIFFFGDTEQYRRIWVRYPKTKLPRESIVAAIKQNYPRRIIVDSLDSLCEILSGPLVNHILLSNTSAVRVAVEDWLPTLAKADFFLCPPGIVMPMSHNIVESMAVGTIPITNYADWMDPPLINGVNCLTFDDHDDLFTALDRAIDMTPAEIETMRQHVLDYYDNYLRPDGFVRRVENHPDPEVPIIMHTERNTALYAGKLGRHSILMQGTVNPRPQGLLRRMAKVYLPNLYRSLLS